MLWRDRNNQNVYYRTWSWRFTLDSHRFVVFCCAIALLLVFFSTPAQAQYLTGPWLKEAEKNIEKHRKVDVTVLVLDLEGNPVPDAKVHLRMLRHDFAWGIRLDAKAFADWPQPPAINRTQPIWRCFNSIALDDVTRWTQLQPYHNTWDYRPVDDMIQWATDEGLAIRWGAVTSANPDRMPAWLQELDDTQFRTVIESHLHRVMSDYGNEVEQFDLHADMIDHNFVTARLGEQMITRMYLQARTLAPRAKLGMRFSNAITGYRLQSMVQTITTFEERFAPVDLVVFDERISGTVLQAPLSRAMNWLRDLNRPAVVGHLEVGGTSPTAAAVNMEVMLRTLFSEPTIKGIWIGGLTLEQVDRPHAALIDAEGKPTPSGKVFEKLVHEAWRTDEKAVADELGNVRTRVFAGTYHITCELPDGTTSDATVYLPVTGEQSMVIMQPIAASGKVENQVE